MSIKTILYYSKWDVLSNILFGGIYETADLLEKAWMDVTILRALNHLLDLALAYFS